MMSKRTNNRKGLEPYRQTFNDGVLKVFEVTNNATSGDMPSEQLTEKCKLPFEYRRIGYHRQFEAMQVGQQIDLVIRTPYRNEITTKHLIRIDGITYRIVLIERSVFEMPPVMDITLCRMEW